MDYGEQHDDHIWFTVRGEGWAIRSITGYVFCLWRGYAPDLEWLILDLSEMDWDEYVECAVEMLRMDDEMMKALEADGEKLRQLTGEDHGPYFFEEHTCPYCKQPVTIRVSQGGVVSDHGQVLVADWVYHGECWDKQVEEHPP